MLSSRSYSLPVGCFRTFRKYHLKDNMALFQSIRSKSGVITLEPNFEILCMLKKMSHRTSSPFVVATRKMLSKVSISIAKKWFTGMGNSLNESAVISHELPDSRSVHRGAARMKNRFPGYNASWIRDCIIGDAFHNWACWSEYVYNNRIVTDIGGIWRCLLLLNFSYHI